jgi:hypothetical protein
VAFQHPQRRTHQIAERRRFDDAPQIIDQRRVLAYQSWAAPARPTNATARERCRVELLQTSPEPRACVSGDLGDGLQLTPPGCANFPRREQASPPLVEPRSNIIPAAAYRLRVDHAQKHNALGTTAESPRPVSDHRSQQPKTDLVVLLEVLSLACFRFARNEGGPIFDERPLPDFTYSPRFWRFWRAAILASGCIC